MSGDLQAHLAECEAILAQREAELAAHRRALDSMPPPTWHLSRRQRRFQSCKQAFQRFTRRVRGAALVQGDAVQHLFAKLLTGEQRVGAGRQQAAGQPQEQPFDGGDASAVFEHNLSQTIGLGHQVISSCVETSGDDESPPGVEPGGDEPEASR